MQNLLIFLQAYLFGRLGSKVIGIVLLLSLIWWAGPYIGLRGSQLRLLLMGGLLLALVLFWLIRFLLVRRKAARFHAELQEQQGGAEASRQLEVDELRQKMNKAIASLKSSELGSRYRGNAALYALPWFMIIGPAAAGKTTLLRHSGLHFPYAHGNDIDIRGFGGTRNCDWWFSNEAVLLDTAGRYTTEQQDHEEWLAFLDLLRKHRRQLPLNGVIVALSLAELLTASEADLERHVKIIRDRLDELTNRLGCVFPVHLLLTKCDLLHGFSAFFEDLGDKERGQVWGAWLADGGSEPLATFRQHLAELHRRLCGMRLHKLSMQRRIKSKAELFTFPSQFEAATERIAAFAALLFKENPYQETPRFCGVYFTSATQEGTPLQRMIGNMRQAFGYVEEAAADSATERRSYFIRNFFRDVVFPNAQDVSRTRRLGLIQRGLKTAAILASLAVIVASLFTLSASFTGNAWLLKQGEGAAAELVQQAQSTEGGRYRDFQALSGLLAHHQALLRHRQHLPWQFLLGVYAGNEQLEPVQSLLLNAFEKGFFRPAVATLETRLANHALQWAGGSVQKQDKIRDPYYRELKTYLMLAQPKRLEKSEALPLLAEIMATQLTDSAGSKGLTEEDRANLTALLDLYVTCRAGGTDAAPASLITAKAKLVQQAQAQLRARPDAKRLYVQLQNKGLATLPAINFAALLGKRDPGVFSSNFVLPGLYTAKGWREYVRPQMQKVVRAAAQGDWVTGYLQPDPAGDGGDHPAESAEELSARLEQEIRHLYFADYIEQWYQLLESIRTTPFGSLDAAARQLQLLARQDGPLATLMQAVSRNINVTDVDLPAGATAIPGAAAVAPLVPEMDAPLRDLRRLTEPGEKMLVSLPLNQYLLALVSVQGEVEQLSAAADVPQAACRFAAGILGGANDAAELRKCWISTSSLLNGLDARTRAVAAHLLNAPLRNVWLAVLGQARIHLQQQWNATVYGVFRHKLASRYPFADKGSDATVADLADFFRPDSGVLWSFVEDNLSPFLSARRRRWSQRSWLGAGLDFSPAFINSLSRAGKITSGLFLRAKDEPQVQFAVYPIPSGGVRESMFGCNGQSFVYRNEPQEWQVFQWPGPESVQGSQVYAVASYGRTKAAVNCEGIWGLFHLLQRARVQQVAGGLLYSWELQTPEGRSLTVRFKLKPDRTANVFADGIFSRFRLPADLF